jgi:hypothetical protein
MLLLEYLKGMGEWYAFSPALARAVGGLHEGVLLQFIIWRTPRSDEWVALTQEDIEAATCLTRYQQERARASLAAKGIIEERHEGLPRRLTYRVNAEGLQEAWTAWRSVCEKLADKSVTTGSMCEKLTDQSARNSHTSMRETDTQVCEKLADIPSFLEELERTKEVVVVDSKGAEGTAETATTTTTVGFASEPHQDAIGVEKGSNAPADEDNIGSAPEPWIQVWNRWRESTASPEAHAEVPSIITETHIKNALERRPLVQVLLAARSAALDPFWRGEAAPGKYTKGVPHPQQGLVHALKEENMDRYIYEPASPTITPPRRPPQPQRITPPEDTLTAGEAQKLLGDVLAGKTTRR